MYIKSLEIQGFKSFPEKTVLFFEKPVTGIVGPNGSGKSNISDAILWVMGEQSTRTLRGGKMEDVIFGGTERRSQVGFAEVSLLLDNSDRALDFDSSEVMITRRYYRSGESEYYINRSIVRLRDVNELLMDTGLGREGYSIIGQGKIDDVLSVKSKDRREIFEEAAGISRYRHRKEESERKLVQTEENLLRVNDKISELEMQVEPLREQAATAKKFLLLRDELRSLEVSVWMLSLEKFRTDNEKLERDLVAAKENLSKLGKLIEDTYAESEEYYKKITEVDIETEGLRTQVSSNELRYSETEGEIAVLRSQFGGNLENIERLRDDISQNDTRSGGVSAQISGREERIAAIDLAKAGLSDKLSALQGQFDDIAAGIGSKTSELVSLALTEDNLSSGITERRALVLALASQAQELFDRDSALRLEISAALEKQQEIDSGYKTCMDGLEAAEQSLQSQKNMISGFTLRAQKRREKVSGLQERGKKASIELDTLKSRIAMLRDMEKEYQGYSRSVKEIMRESARGVLKNVHGTVAGLLKTGDKYAAAVETSLGGAAQNIIVDNDEDGKNAITLLKRRDLGRATFLPMSTIRGYTLNESGLDAETGFEGLAISLVEFDGRYLEIYKSLLGRVVIASDMDSAIRIARKYKNKFKVVTLDGQVINAGGSMTGGSAISNSGIISRANELNNLTTQHEKVQEGVLLLEKELAEASRELAASEYELGTANAELRDIEDRLLVFRRDRQHFEELSRAAAQNIQDLKKELSEVSDRTTGNGSDTEGLQTEIETAERELAAIKEKIQLETEGQDSLNAIRETINVSLSDIRTELSTLDTERGVLENAVTELRVLRDDLSGNITHQMELVGELSRKNESITESIAEKEAALSSLSLQVENLKNKLSELNALKLDYEAIRVRISRETQDKNKELLDSEREVARLEQKLLSLELEEKQIVDKLWDTYELSRMTAEDVRLEIDNPAQANRKISELKREISRLGNPNIGAIEEFDRVNTRYEYLSEQRDDVTKAKDELLGIVREITKQMKEIFMREFELINASFGKTFLELFGGGKATLSLEDPDDVLGCGIEIQVQPPGKSLKNITLLSGGEKAFVAIALYFAILNVRPTPFVVMDEIEAALDDANVIRFAEHLRRMSRNTQMIVITHRRGTMEEADVLYGVTMQEMGVSRVLKVELDKIDYAFEKRD